MRLVRFALFAGLALVALAGGGAPGQQPGKATLEPGENLLASLPQGWELGFSDRDGGRAVYEYVPAGDSVEDWREMMTVQIFFNLNSVPPPALLDQMRAGFAAECESSGVDALVERTVNGYPTARQLLFCGRGQQTGMGEAALVLAVAGRDSFYVVQRAWRGDPFKGPAPAAVGALLAGWTQHLDSIRVCDTRDKSKPCD